MTEQDEFFDESALFAAVENQLADGNPLAVKGNYAALRMTGFSHQEALEFIACALAAEIMVMEESRFHSMSSAMPDFGLFARDAMG